MVLNLDNFIIDVIIKVKFYNNSIKKKIIIFLVDTPQLIGMGKYGKDNNAKREGFGYEFIFTLKNPYNIPPSKYNIK